MRSLDETYEHAAQLNVPPSMVVKSVLGREVVSRVAAVQGVVLQGGGALHHIYGSPRFSAELREQLRGVLPGPRLDGLDVVGLLDRVGHLLRELSR